jgi:hypothetical protein
LVGRAGVKDLLLYTYLQAMDVLSTVAFLISGVQEANPLVRWALTAFSNPVSGLLAVKVIAMMLGLYCFGAGRIRLLRRVNMAFAALVAWNLLSLILGLSGRS